MRGGGQTSGAVGVAGRAAGAVGEEAGHRTGAAGGVGEEQRAAVAGETRRGGVDAGEAVGVANVASLIDDARVIACSACDASVARA